MPVRNTKVGNTTMDMTAAYAFAPCGQQVKRDIPDYRIFDTGWFTSHLMDVEYRSWALGTGMLIDVTGEMMFDNNNVGANLNWVTVINKSTGVVYVGANTPTPSVASGVPLEYNESFTWSGHVHKIWGICATGTSIMVGHGTFDERGKPNL